MVVIRQGWVEKSSGGKKDGSSGAMLTGKESWKKRYVVVENTPESALRWYKTDKVGCQVTCHSRHICRPCALAFSL